MYYILEFPRCKLIYDSKIHDMHKYVNFNLSGKCNKSDFAMSQRGKEGRKERGRKRERERERERERNSFRRDTLLRTISLSHEQESTVYLARRSYYANSVNSSAISDTRIKDIDAVGRVWNMLSTSLSGMRKYLRGVLLVADTPPITLQQTA